MEVEEVVEEDEGGEESLRELDGLVLGARKVL
jgi:hypothetical protein